MPVVSRAVLGLLALLAPLTGAARAGEVFPFADDPVLSALVSEALEKSPEVRAAGQSAVAARARAPQAATLPDPVIAVGYQYGGTGGLPPGRDEDTFLGFTVSQALPFKGKLRLAGEVESKGADRAEQRLERVRRTLVADIRRAYAELLLARENLALIDEQEEANRGIEAVTRSRYAVGLSEQPDVLRAQAELARLRQMRMHEEGNEKAALAALNRLLARPAGTPVPPSRSLASLAEMDLRVPSLDEVLPRAEAASPELADARLAIERSRLALDLARRGLKPDFDLSAGYMNRGGMPDMWAVNLSIVVPARAGRKQRQGVVEAEARLRTDEADVEAVKLRLRAGVERNLAEYEAAVREVDAYGRGVLVVDRLASEAALANYTAGKVPFVSVLEAHITRYRDRWQYLELLWHVLLHSANLEELAAAD